MFVRFLVHSNALVSHTPVSPAIDDPYYTREKNYKHQWPRRPARGAPGFSATVPSTTIHVQRTAMRMRLRVLLGSGHGYL